MIQRWFSAEAEWLKMAKVSENWSCEAVLPPRTAQVLASLLLVCVVPLACDTNPGSEPAPSRQGRGAAVSVEKLHDRSLSETHAELKRWGLPVAARFGVRVYKLLYETISPQGDPTVASGALLVPSPALGSLDMVGFQHGTILLDSEAPSQSEEMRLIGLAYAADGYVAVLPDLLGLGEGPGIHPYFHAASAATAVVDMLRATHDLAESEGWVLSGQLFLSGYSQGGHTAMVAHHVLEEEYADEFTVTASAPMAGPYDLSGIMLEIMLDRKAYPSPCYLPYLLRGYNEVYGFVGDLSEFFASPYDTLIPPLLDGTHRCSDINALLPDVPRDMLNPEMVEELERNPNHLFRQALAENDVYHWAPEVPIRLYHCSGDRHVPIAHAYKALDHLSGGAGTVELVEPVQAADHGDCAVFAIFAGKAWIDTF